MVRAVPGVFACKALDRLKKLYNFIARQKNGERRGRPLVIKRVIAGHHHTSGLSFSKLGFELSATRLNQTLSTGKGQSTSGAKS